MMAGLLAAAPGARCGQAASAPAAPSTPAKAVAFTRLHASAQKILNAEGEEVRLRGVNLGGWLVKEGYIIHFPEPAYDSPSEIDQLVRDLAGPELGDQLLAEHREQWISEADFAEIAALGFNSVRVPLHFGPLWDLAAEKPREDGLQFLDRIVGWSERYHLWLFPDLHCAPGGQNAGNISDSDGTARLYSDARDQEATIRLWRTIAARYRDRDAIGGYDLLNEPVWSSGADVADLYRRTAAAIREVDPRHLIVLEGNTWATDFSMFGASADGNLLYSFHKYWNATDEASIQPFLLFASRVNAPLWLGETGENNTRWYQETLGLMKRHEIGWCFWPWKKIATDNTPLSVQPAAGTFSRITEYLDNLGPRPTPEETAIGWREMLRAASADRCRRNADVIALLQAN